MRGTKKEPKTKKVTKAKKAAKKAKPSKIATLRKLGKTAERCKVVSSKLTEMDHKRLIREAKEAGLSLSRTISTIIKMHFGGDKIVSMRQNSAVASKE